MINPHRVKRAENEGYISFKETRGRPERVEVPYPRFSALWRAFNRGWNKRRKDEKGNEFEFLKPVET